MENVELPAQPGLFTRASSGLVRQVGTADTGIYALMQIVFGYFIFIIAVWAFYPGASMELSTAITIIGSIALGLVYALLSAVYPRSGGEYVFISRALHPLLAFMSTGSSAIWQSYYVGLNGAFAAKFGFAPMFAFLGLQTHNKTLLNIGEWFGKSWGMFLTAVFFVVVLSLILYRGMRIYFLVQRWVAGIALASMAVAIFVLFLGWTGALNFQAHFNALAGPGAYQRVIADGTAAGAILHPGFSFVQTLDFMIWPAFSLLFAVMSTSFSGEIKNVKRSQLVGITGALVLGGLLILGLMFFTRLAVGNSFLLAATSAPDKFPLPVSPWASVLAAITAHNVLLTVLVSLWAPLSIAYACGVAAVYVSRIELAWAIDGMVPERLGDVSEKYHSPTYTIVLTAILAIIGVAIFSFTSLITLLSGLLGFGVGFGLAGVTGILFPILHRDTFEGSPAAIRVGRVPLLSLAGVVAVVFVGFVLYRVVVDSTFGANTRFSIWTSVAIFALAGVWYYGARWVRRRQGVDLTLRYKEIPIE